jgi:beta-mannosidase
MTRERYENLIRSAVDTHQNMLRIWGGGYYEDEAFYDLCDEYGILLWHDFMFACYIYPHDEPEFIANLKLEVEDNVRRLRHRACIALWCGNNEMEQGWTDWGWSKREDPWIPVQKAAYEQYFYHTLPEWLGALDADRPYWPSSASSNTPMVDANGMNRGDMHYWDVWHGRKPFTAYRDQFPRFMSEFGFQAFPPIETVKDYTPANQLNITSYVMELHQRSWKGNTTIVIQMTDSFRMPKDFSSMIYLSLILQAEGIRYGVEHWRRAKLRTSGTLYWQLNDCWPVASWASLDYYGRWKALHYAARRFYAPLLLSIEETGSKMDVHLTSDLNQPVEGQVKWTLATLDGQVMRSGETSAALAPLATQKVLALDFTGDVGERGRELAFIAELWQAGQRVSYTLAHFAPIKHLEMRFPGLLVKTSLAGGLAAFDVSARSLARFVELKLDGADVVFSDNYFDVPAGWTVRVTCPLPAGWDLAKLQAALRVMDLSQSY